jgi:hypothetical protein
MTAYDDDYRELIVQAQDAVCDLLRASTPDSWMDLRGGYREMRTALAADAALHALEETRQARHDARREREETEQERRVKWEREREEWREWERVWRNMPRSRRESLVFDVLGDESLIIREIADRVNDELARLNREHGLKQPTGSGRIMYEDGIRPTVMRMLNAGQLERSPETFRKTRTRYRFTRKRGLDGPIVDLERAYHDDREARS